MAPMRPSGSSGGEARGRVFEVRILPTALDVLKSLPKADQKRVWTIINGLKANPRPEGARALKGERGFLRVRTGN